MLMATIVPPEKDENEGKKKIMYKGREVWVRPPKEKMGKDVDFRNRKERRYHNRITNRRGS